MKKQSKKNLKIISATAASLFSLVAVFTATFAWFALNHTVNSSGMTIKVKESGQSFSEMTLHRCLFDQSTTETYVFNETPEFTISSSSSQTGSFEMLDYDTGGSHLSTNQPVLLLFKLGVSGSGSSAVHEGVDPGSVNLTARTTAVTNDTFPLIADSSNVENYPFSQCVQFQSIAGISTTFDFTISTSVLVPTTTTFATVDGDDWSFAQNITIYQGSGSSNIFYLGIVMDYYAEAITHVMSMNLGNSYIETNGRLGFLCDWIMEI